MGVDSPSVHRDSNLSDISRYDLSTAGRLEYQFHSKRTMGLYAMACCIWSRTICAKAGMEAIINAKRIYHDVNHGYQCNLRRSQCSHRWTIKHRWLHHFTSDQRHDNHRLAIPRILRMATWWNGGRNLKKLIGNKNHQGVIKNEWKRKNKTPKIFMATC